MTERQVNIGVVGIGNMGSKHAQHLIDLPNTALAAVCDNKLDRVDRLGIAPEIPRFSDYREMLEQGDPGCHHHRPRRIMTTRRYAWLPLSAACMSWSRKPIAVHVKDAARMTAAYEAAKRRREELVFAAMFQQRTWGHWRKIKAMIDAGELGRLQRCTWLITDWFRTQQYYDSGDWRATLGWRRRRRLDEPMPRIILICISGCWACPRARMASSNLASATISKSRTKLPHISNMRAA